MTAGINKGEILPDMIFLEQTRVAPITASRYRRALKEWKASTAYLARGLLVEDAAVDASLVNFMNEMFLRGDQPAKGETLMAGVFWKMPEFGRYGGRRLP